ncbi:hypothetical protein PC123_g19368 [Phytophthora cactorum]|nr:hypothetical protein PC123_g19368 [Phytophthora cactorum]
MQSPRDSSTPLLYLTSAALHDYVATRLERALGRSLPHMEVRFNRL